jgi:molecular chaperone DnaK (HSP70)
MDVIFEREPGEPLIQRVRFSIGPPSCVGDAALDETPEGACTVRCAKRVIGQAWAAPGVQALLPSLPFAVVAGEGGECAARVSVGARDATWALSALQAQVVAALKAQAEAYLDRRDHRTFAQMGAAAARPARLTRCVVGVPVHFDERQRRATREAAKLAGFTEVALMAESTAAAVAYGLFIAGTKNVLVFDCGGGTTDVTLVRTVRARDWGLRRRGHHRRRRHSRECLPVVNTPLSPRDADRELRVSRLYRCVWTRASLRHWRRRGTTALEAKTSTRAS